MTAFDISADLTELGKTPVAIVCAGAKSILDIGLTLEYLVSCVFWLFGFGKNLLIVGPVCLYVCLSICLSVCQSVCLSIYVYVYVYVVDNFLSQLIFVF